MTRAPPSSSLFPCTTLFRSAPATLALAFLPAAPGLATGLAGPASVGVLWKILAYFAGASLFVFGSGLAIVPFLYGGVVQQFHWLTEPQFIDAVGVSMITPGPVVITAAFIGYPVEIGRAHVWTPATVKYSMP